MADFIAVDDAINEVLLVPTQVLCPWSVQIPFEPVFFSDLGFSRGGFARGMLRELEGRVVPWGKRLFYLCGACLFSERKAEYYVVGIPSRGHFLCTRPCKRHRLRTLWRTPISSVSLTSKRVML